MMIILVILWVELRWPMLTFTCGKMTNSRVSVVVLSPGCATGQLVVEDTEITIQLGSECCAIAVNLTDPSIGTRYSFT